MSDLAGAWRVPAVCLALAFTLLAASGWCVLSRATSPSDGTVVNLGDQAVQARAAIIQQTTPDGLFRAGDEVIAIDGVRIRDAVAAGVGGRPVKVGDTATYELRRDGQDVTVTKTLRLFPLADAIDRNWPTLLVLALILIVSAGIFTARPGDPAAQAALLSSALAFITTSGSTHFQLEAIDLVAGGQFWRWYTGEFGFLLLWASTLHMAIAFPSVHDRRAYRRKVAAGYLGALVLYGVMAGYALQFVDDPLGRLSLLGSPVLPVLFSYPVIVIGVLVYRFRNVRDDLDRNRMAWLVWSLGGGAVIYVVLFVLPQAIFGHPLLPNEYHTLAFLPVPIGVAAAILRYRALNIEVVVSRSLVYGALSAGTIGLYIGLVSLLSLLFPPIDKLWQQAAAAAGVAVLVQPLRSRLQSLINKRLFGDRHDPYLVVATLAARLEQIRTPSEMLPALVETIGTALRLPYAAIEIQGTSGGQNEQAASFGEATGELVRLPLSYQGEQVGQLAVAPRGPRETLGRRDQLVLAEVARHAGAAVYTVRLTRDLRRSRDNVVQAREEERRRLLHDLHDGVGPSLAAISLGLHACRKAVGPASSQGELLGTLHEELEGAINEIRRLAHGLRPPELDRIGLVGAIRAYASALSARADDQGVTIALDVPISMPRLPATVDVAAYRIVSEALTNVTRHACARSCAVRLWVDDDLHIEVVDDGIGLPEQHATGVGLWSMRERATELGGNCVVSADVGGGTTVRATLPLPKEGG
ncbi:sensor histidine kinase [Actinocrispum wychmicini]|uniref:Oxygen sensor histidine kinase NreB n=1 Tax=Actinocrispum wychmicini TaxID=1213861 RepID=A0A4R2JAS6_9PSEU|nr:ATP-binding protein [Actinocrispum wychmicini]TCO56553.1 histidine kinase/DNA gyrase B/HSP90-like ATPase [Actinocrispum wychmicini]